MVTRHRGWLATTPATAERLHGGEEEEGGGGGGGGDRLVEGECELGGSRFGFGLRLGLPPPRRLESSLLAGVDIDADADHDHDQKHDQDQDQGQTRSLQGGTVANRPVRRLPPPAAAAASIYDPLTHTTSEVLLGGISETVATYYPHRPAYTKRTSCVSWRAPIRIPPWVPPPPPVRPWE